MNDAGNHICCFLKLRLAHSSRWHRGWGWEEEKHLGALPDKWPYQLSLEMGEISLWRRICYSCVLSTLQRSVFFVDPGWPLGFMISQQEIPDSVEAAKMSEMSTWRGLGEARV